MNLTTSSKTFLKRAELAARWGCSISTIKRRELAGELVPMKSGRIVRYSIPDIEKIEQPNGSLLSAEKPA